MIWIGNERVDIEVLPGFTLTTRPALCDETVIEEVIRRDCYKVFDLNLDGRTIIDCGAHIGVFATMCALRGARVIAIEPQPENLELLRVNAKQFPRITILPFAVGATEGMTYIDGESGGAHTGPEGIPVDQVTLSSLLDGPVDVLKLDMEGGEVAALLACDHKHLKRAHRVVLETHGPKICPWVDRPHVGELVEHLLPTHDVQASGFPSHLGYIHAVRNLA